MSVVADIIGGSGKTVQFSLRGAHDVMFADGEFGASRSSAGTFPFGPSAFTVGKAVVTVVKSPDSVSGRVGRGEFAIPLASFTLSALGENLKVETLNIGMITNDPANVTIRNVRIFAAGRQIGSVTPVPAESGFLAGSGTQFTAGFTVPAGGSVTLVVQGDTIDSEGADEIGSGSVTTIQAVLIGLAEGGNAVLQDSLEAISVPAEANVPGNVLEL